MLSRRQAPVLLIALLLAPAFAGCVESPLTALGESGLYAVVSAPWESGGMTIFVMAEQAIGKPDGQANYVIRFGDEIVYPPGGKGGIIPIRDGRGTLFVPYNLFVVGNGKYTVEVSFGADSTTLTTPIEKWVHYVYLHPYDRGNKIVIDTQLSRATGGLPSSRINTAGDLQLMVRYRGPDGQQDRPVGQPLRVTTNADESFTRVEVPRSHFSEGTGYYSVEPVFHNHQANGNLWVGPDPTMAQRSPPWNWIWVQR